MTKTPATTTAELYPLFARLRDRLVVVIGAGPVAADKATALLSAGARVRLVAPVWSARAAALPVARVERVEREFVAADLDEAWLIVAAAPPEINRAVQAAAEARQKLVIAVDDPEHGSAYGAATFERGGVTVALSSGGRAPALVAILRRALETLITDEVKDWIHLAERLRAEWRSSDLPHLARRTALQQAIAALPEGAS